MIKQYDWKKQDTQVSVNYSESFFSWEQTDLRKFQQTLKDYCFARFASYRNIWDYGGKNYGGVWSHVFLLIHSTNIYCTSITLQKINLYRSQAQKENHKYRKTNSTTNQQNFIPLEPIHHMVSQCLSLSSEILQAYPFLSLCSRNLSQAGIRNLLGVGTHVHGSWRDPSQSRTTLEKKLRKYLLKEGIK